VAFCACTSPFLASSPFSPLFLFSLSFACPWQAVMKLMGEGGVAADVVTYNSLMQAHIKGRDAAGARAVFQSMTRAGVKGTTTKAGK
jgi:pentatricopeptide repeat protein